MYGVCWYNQDCGHVVDKQNYARWPSGYWWINSTHVGNCSSRGLPLQTALNVAVANAKRINAAEHNTMRQDRRAGSRGANVWSRRPIARLYWNWGLAIAASLPGALEGRPGLRYIPGLRILRYALSVRRNMPRRALPASPKNPFEFGRELNADELVDREAELDLVRRTIINRGRLFFIGPRRYGKTSVLHAAE
jgi:hypothetical protein